MTRYYTVMIFMNIFAMLIIQLCISKSNTLTKGRKILFHTLFNAIIVAAFCEWYGNFLQGSGESTRIIHIVVKAIELSVAPTIAFLSAWIIDNRREKWAYYLLGIHAVVECLSGVFGFIYYVDENSNYMHMKFYWIYIFMYVISIIYCISIVVRNVKKYQYNGIGYFLLIVALMVTGIGIQLYDSSLKVDYVTVAIASVMLYVFTLEMIYQTDELTELINRRGYENYISHIEDKSVIVFFDVNSFKNVNDTYGHAFGDYALKIIGKAIKHQYSKYGKCFRYGGDEFCAILTKRLEDIKLFNDKFNDEISRERQKEVRLPGVSIGYTYFDPQNQNIKDAIEEADQMMYKNKEKHKKK